MLRLTKLHTPKHGIIRGTHLLSRVAQTAYPSIPAAFFIDLQHDTMHALAHFNGKYFGKWIASH